MTDQSSPSRSQEQAVEARRLAEEALEWVRDFEAGQFHVICQRCQAPHPYLPVEFYGLVESQKELATLLSQREEELVEAREALEFECGFARDAKAQARGDASRTHHQPDRDFELGRAAAFAEMSERLYRALSRSNEWPQ